MASAMLWQALDQGRLQPLKGHATPLHHRLPYREPMAVEAVFGFYRVCRTGWNGP
ncbi:MAG TPA: hypothetical protein VMW51_01240 [Terriglobia bacterium]|nr:hypothetical protein [Terriglobia bacterium]